MKVTFFGFNGAAQSRDSGNTSFLVETGGHAVLVDASGDPVRHLARAGRPVTEVDSLVLTHTHTDHIYALPSLIHNMYMLRRKKPLRLVGEGGTLAFARSLLDMFGLRQRPGGPEFLWLEAGPGQPLDCAGGVIEFFPALHSCPCLGLLVREPGATLVYSSDSAPNPALDHLDVNSPVLIHEATGLHEDAETLNGDGHSSARQAGAAALRMGASALFICSMRAASSSDVEHLRHEAAVACQAPVVVPVIDKSYAL